MKLTFPHLGNVYIPVKGMLDELGIDYIIPPRNNKKSLELGTKYAPEMSCLPLKITIGNLIQAYEKGADTILMLGGRGPCRFGYYCEMQREILNDAGYNMDVIVLDVPNIDNIKKFFMRIKIGTSSLNLLKKVNIFDMYKIAKIVKDTVDISRLVDALEKKSFKVRPREQDKGSTDRIMKNFHDDVLKTKGTSEIKRLIQSTMDKLDAIKQKEDFSPLKIGIVGEIYTTIDSYTSFYIQERLGNMGVEVDRAVTISDWIIEHMLKNALKLPRDLRYAEAAKPYLKTMIGGHAQETVGNTILYAKQGYDGVIQIYPLTCMPEIVAESILPEVEKDFDIPVLTLIIDEMTGEAGYITRIEAFIDLLNRRKERAALDGKWAFSRY